MKGFLVSGVAIERLKIVWQNLSSLSGWAGE